MNPVSSLSPPILVGLTLIPLTIALGQLLFKVASQRLEAAGRDLYMVLFDPVMILALGIYGGATLIWIYLLKFVPLSYAYSFMALTFLAVPILSIFFLGETLSLKYWVGTALIIAGLTIIQS